MPQKNAEKELREFFGITQQDFARYLGISRSHLAMVEIGERELNGPAALKYAQLLSFVFGKGGWAGRAQKLPPLTADEKKLLLQKAADCEYESEKCRRKLAAMQMAYQVATRALAMVGQLLPTLPNNKDGKKDKLILEIIEADAQKSLQKNSPGAQALLQWKLDGWVADGERAKELTE